MFLYHTLPHVRNCNLKTEQPATPLIERIPSFRAAPAPDVVIANLGLLGKLAGRWAGKGFNLIARPDFEGHNDIFLELNLTN